MPIRATVELYPDTELELRIRSTRPSVIDATGDPCDEQTGVRTIRPLAKCGATQVRQLRAARAG
jgi:hypothetical protein